MGSIDDIKSTLTQSALDALCEKFHILDTDHHELPGRNNRIRNSPTGKIGLSVSAAAKVSYFEILCRVHGFILTVGNFPRSRRHFKTLSLDELRLPDFNLLSDQEYSKEEEAEAMAETLEQYISKTRTDYGSGVAIPKIDNKDQFELKGQFLKELRENTFSGSDNEDANEHIKKVLKIVDLFHVPNITCPQHYLTEMQELILFYNGLDVSTRQILNSRGAVPTKTAEVAKKAIQEMAEYSQKWHNGTSNGRSTETSNGLTAIQAQLNSLGREIEKVNEKVYAAQVGCEQCKGPHYTKDCPLKEEGKTLEEAYYTQFGGPFQGGGYRATAPWYYQRNNANPSQNSTLLYKSRQMKDPFLSRLDNHYYEEEEGNYGPKLMEAYRASHINNVIPRKEKDPESFTLPCFINNTCFDNALVDLGASVSVMPLSTYLNFGLGELAHTRLTVELVDRTVKYPKGIAENLQVGISKFTFPLDFIILNMPEDIKVPLILGRPFLSTFRAKINVYKRKITLRVSLRERMELDLEARLIGETLVLNRSLDPFLEDYIELNNLNEPFELRRNQRDDLIPTIEEGEVIEEFRIRDKDLDTGIEDYPSNYDDDKKIHIDCAHNLKFSSMIGFEFTYANVFLLLYVNVMSKEFHKTFSVMTDFAVMEDMDDYRDEGMAMPKSKNVKIRVNTEESAVKPEPELKNTIGCNLEDDVVNLNTINHRKFDGKADEGFFIGYSTNSKAFRVFNTGTRIIEENPHVQFSKNTPNIAGSGLNWLFDIDALTKSLNYKLVVAGNQSNGSADLQFLFNHKDSPDAGFKPSREEEKKDVEDPENKDSEVPSTEEPRVNQEEDANINNTNNINTVSQNVNAAGIEDNAVDENIVYGCVDDLNMPNLEEIV
ncbi:putative reverse transcriptase domain-containing protein [Tanacetum coccineum]